MTHVHHLTIMLNSAAYDRGGLVSLEGRRDPERDLLLPALQLIG
jgi:hypothetical protein